MTFSFRKRVGHLLWSNTPSIATTPVPPAPSVPPAPPGIPAFSSSQPQVSFNTIYPQSKTVTAHSTTVPAPPPAPPEIKMIRTGRCTEPFCACPVGIFELPINEKSYGAAGELLCGTQDRVGCRHLLSAHEDAPLPSNDIIATTLSNSLIRTLTRPDIALGDPSQATSSPTRDPVSRDPAVCPRRGTVENLWSLVREVRVVQCRGTPTSGKSTLARLLENFVVNNYPNMQVVYMSWPSSASQDERTLPFDVMIKRYASVNWEGTIFELSNLLLICDEAQNSYPFHGYWNDFVKMQASGANAGPYIVMFSSFGSPAATAVPFPGSAPPYLSLEQRLSMRSPSGNSQTASLYFPRPEFDDVVQRVCEPRNASSEQFVPSQDLLDYIYNITAGHPGCVRAILNVFIRSEHLRPFRIERRDVDLESGLLVVKASNFFENLGYSAGFGRSLPPKRVVQQHPEAARVLQNAVVRHNVIGELETDNGLDVAYKRGWLHAELTSGEQIHYIFPTELHRLYCEKLLISNNRVFPLDLYDSLDVFWLAAVMEFSSESLTDAGHVLSGGGVMRPVELAYRDELYRSCYKILNEKCFLVSEWSANQGDRIDFFVSGGVNWGIQCVREGINLDEHISRFQAGGRYYNWTQDSTLADYVILDFRKTTPISFKAVPRLYHVIYNNDYSECRILQSDGTERAGPFRLRD